MTDLATELADEIAEAISDSLDMDWTPSWAVPAIMEIIQRERMAAAEKVRDFIAEGSWHNADANALHALDLSTIIRGESDD